MSDAAASMSCCAPRDGDAGSAAVDVPDRYVEVEPPARIRLDVPWHRDSSQLPSCRTDHDGLLQAARRFADVPPEQTA